MNRLSLIHPFAEITVVTLEPSRILRLPVRSVRWKHRGRRLYSCYQRQWDHGYRLCPMEWLVDRLRSSVPTITDACRSCTPVLSSELRWDRDAQRPSSCSDIFLLQHFWVIGAVVYRTVAPTLIRQCVSAARNFFAAAVTEPSPTDAPHLVARVRELLDHAITGGATAPPFPLRNFCQLAPLAYTGVLQGFAFGACLRSAAGTRSDLALDIARRQPR